MIADTPESASERPTMSDAEAEAEATADPAASRSRRLWVPLVVALVALLLVAGAAWTAVAVRKEQQAQDRDDDALAAGREAAVAFTSYDYRHIDDDLDRVASRSTGDFRQQFTKALGALSAAIKKAHGVSLGEVSQAGIVRSTDDTAVVIAAVDATITNRSTQGESTRRYRLQITLNLVDDDWLISDISPVA
ncbi:hypothetical protein [Nocardioides sp. MH1]|uniref:hypothetical protein n=1 Tax=Nocardioides sp. MH1 TaxID=3242490 RepID=UPI00352085D9